MELVLFPLHQNDLRNGEASERENCGRVWLRVLCARIGLAVDARVEVVAIPVGRVSVVAKGARHVFDLRSHTGADVLHDQVMNFACADVRMEYAQSAKHHEQRVLVACRLDDIRPNREEPVAGRDLDAGFEFDLCSVARRQTQGFARICLAQNTDQVGVECLDDDPRTGTVGDHACDCLDDRAFVDESNRIGMGAIRCVGQYDAHGEHPLFRGVQLQDCEIYYDIFYI